MIDIVEEALAHMAKRRVSQVVAQANRLDQIAVEPRARPISRAMRDKLHMQTTARQVIVTAKAKDLRFACITRVRRKMKNLFRCRA